MHYPTNIQRILHYDLSKKTCSQMYYKSLLIY